MFGIRLGDIISQHTRNVNKHNILSDKQWFSIETINSNNAGLSYADFFMKNLIFDG